MKLLRWLDENLEECLMLALLVGMVLVMGLQVLCRYAFNNSLSWSEEITRHMFIWSAFLSIGLCIRKNLALKIDMLLNMFSPKLQAVVLILGDILMLAYFAYMLKFAWAFAWASVLSGQRSAAVGIPMYFIQFSVFTGFLIAVLRLAQDIWLHARRLSSRKPAADGERG